MYQLTGFPTLFVIGELLRRCTSAGCYPVACPMRIEKRKKQKKIEDGGRQATNSLCGQSIPIHDTGAVETWQETTRKGERKPQKKLKLQAAKTELIFDKGLEPYKMNRLLQPPPLTLYHSITVSPCDRFKLPTSTSTASDSISNDYSSIFNLLLLLHTQSFPPPSCFWQWYFHSVLNDNNKCKHD